MAASRRIRPTSVAASIQAAIDRTRLKQTDKAIADLWRFTATHPDNVTAWTALGDAYRSVERFADAAKAYDHAVKAMGARDQEGLAAVLCARRLRRAGEELERRRGRSEAGAEALAERTAGAELSGL